MNKESQNVRALLGISIGAAVPGPAPVHSLVPPEDSQQCREIIDRYYKSTKGLPAATMPFLFRKSMQRAMNETARLPQPSGRPCIDGDNAHGAKVHVPFVHRPFFHDGFVPRGHGKTSKFLAICGNLCWEPGCASQIRRQPNLQQEGKTAPSVDPTTGDDVDVSELGARVGVEMRAVRDNHARIGKCGMPYILYRQLVCQTCGRLNIRFFRPPPSSTHYHHTLVMESITSADLSGADIAPSSVPVIVSHTNIYTTTLHEVLKDVRDSTWVALGFPPDHNPIDACYYPVRSGYRMTEAYQKVQQVTVNAGQKKKVVRATPDVLFRTISAGFASPIVNSAGKPFSSIARAARNSAARISRSRSARQESERKTKGAAPSKDRSSTAMHKFHDVGRAIFEAQQSSSVGATQTARHPRFDTDVESLHPATVGIPASLVYGLVGNNAAVTSPEEVSPHEWAAIIECEKRTGKHVLLPFRILTLDGVELTFGRPRLVNGGLSLYDTLRDGTSVFVWPDIQRTLASGAHGRVIIRTYLTNFSAIELSRSPEMYQLPGAYVEIVEDINFKDIPLHGQTILSSVNHGLGVAVQTAIILLKITGGDIDGDRVPMYIISRYLLEMMNMSRHYLVRPGVGNVELTLNDMFGPIAYLTSGGLCTAAALGKLLIEVKREKHSAPGWDSLTLLEVFESSLYPWNPSATMMWDPYNPLGKGVSLNSGEPDEVLLRDPVLTEHWTDLDKKTTKTCTVEASAALSEPSGACLRPFVCFSATDQTLVNDIQLNEDVVEWGRQKKAAPPSANITAPTDDLPDELRYQMHRVVVDRCVGECRSSPDTYRVTREEACVAAVFSRYGIMVYRKHDHPHNLGVQLKNWLIMLRASHLPVHNMLMHLHMLEKSGEITSSSLAFYLKEHPIAFPVVAFPCDLKELQVVFKRVRALHWNCHAPYWLYSHIFALCDLSALMLYQTEIPLGDDWDTDRAFIDDYRAAYIRDVINDASRKNFDHSSSHLQRSDVSKAIKSLGSIMHFPAPSGKQKGTLSLVVGMPQYTEVGTVCTVHPSQAQRSAYLTTYPGNNVPGHADRRDTEGISPSELHYIGRIGSYWQSLLIVSASYYLLQNGVSTPVVALGQRPVVRAERHVPQPQRHQPSFSGGDFDEVTAEWKEQSSADDIVASLESSSGAIDIGVPPSTPVDLAPIWDLFEDEGKEGLMNLSQMDLLASPISTGSETKEYISLSELNISEDVVVEPPVVDEAFVIETPFPLSSLEGTNEQRDATRFLSAAENHELIGISPFETPVHRCHLLGMSPAVARSMFKMQFPGNVWGDGSGSDSEWLNTSARHAFCGCRSVFKGGWHFVSSPRIHPIPMSPGVHNGKWGGITGYGSASWRDPIVGVETLPIQSFFDLLPDANDNSKLVDLEAHLRANIKQQQASSHGCTRVWTPPVPLERLLCGQSIESWMQWLMPHSVIADIRKQMRSLPPLKFIDEKRSENIVAFSIVFPRTHFKRTGTTDKYCDAMETVEFAAPVNAFVDALRWVEEFLTLVLKAYRTYIGRVCITHVLMPPMWGHSAILSSTDDISGDKVVELFAEITELFQSVIDNSIPAATGSAFAQCEITGHGICQVHDPALIVSNSIDIFPFANDTALAVTCIGSPAILAQAKEWRRKNEATVAAVLEQDFALDNLKVLPFLKCLSADQLIRSWMFAHADAFWLEPDVFVAWFVTGLQQVLNRDDTAGRFHPYKALIAMGHNNALQHVLDLIKNSAGNLGMTANEVDPWKLSPQTTAFPHGTVFRVTSDVYSKDTHDHIYTALDYLWIDPVCPRRRRRSKRVFLPIVCSSSQRPLFPSTSFGRIKRRLAAFEFIPTMGEDAATLRSTYIRYCSYVFACSPVYRDATPIELQSDYQMSVVVVNDTPYGKGVHSPSFNSKIGFTELRVTSSSKENFKGRDVATIVIPHLRGRVVVIVIPAVSKLNSVSKTQPFAQTTDVSRLLLTNDNKIFRPDTWNVSLETPDLVSVSGDFENDQFTLTTPKSRSVALTMLRLVDQTATVGVSVYPWLGSLCWETLGCGGAMHARSRLVGSFVGKDWPSVFDGATTAFLGDKGMVPNATEKSLSADVMVQGFMRNQGNRSLHNPMYFDRTTLIGRIIIGSNKKESSQPACPKKLKLDGQVEKNPFPNMS